MGFSTENRLESTSWIDRWLSAAAEMDEADQARPPRLMQQPTGLGGRSLQSVRLKGIQLNSYSAESRSSASSALHGKTNDHDQEPGASRRGDGLGSPAVVLSNRGFRFNSGATHRRRHGYERGADFGDSGGIRSVGAEQPGWWRTWAGEITERADNRAVMPPIGGLIVPPLRMT